MQKADCAICREVSTEVEHGRVNRIIDETKHFCSFVTLGPLTLGHLLISTRKHLPSMGSLSQENYEDFRRIREDLGERLIKSFHLPQIILFEHGPSRDSEKAGCCIDHAHMNIMPAHLLTTRVVDELQDSLGRHVTLKDYSDLRELSEEGEIPYAFFELEGIKYFWEIKKPIPSQYLRQIIGKYLGRQFTWNWRTYPRMGDTIETVERMK